MREKQELKETQREREWRRREQKWATKKNMNKRKIETRSENVVTLTRTSSAVITITLSSRKFGFYFLCMEYGWYGYGKAFVGHFYFTRFCSFLQLQTFTWALFSLCRVHFHTCSYINCILLLLWAWTWTVSTVSTLQYILFLYVVLILVAQFFRNYVRYV